jgi:putative permease
MLAFGTLLILWLGSMLAPLFTAIVIAYLMQGLVNILLRFGASARAAFIAVYLVFVGLFVLSLVFLLPQAWNQLRRLVDDLPNLLTQWQGDLMLLPESYPNLISESQVQDFISGIRTGLGAYGQDLLQFWLFNIPNVIGWGVFTVLVPTLVFFVMKDKNELIDWVGNFLPRNRPLMIRIWHEMDVQISNYVRGKGLEILIVGLASFVLFSGVGLNYKVLLSVGVGLSVMVPYIGAAVITIPVAAVAYVQWGIGPEFYVTVIGYGVLQLLDGNVLVPIIFSEAVNLHPVAILAAVLIFGGLWGLAGVFFAIPLATLIKVIMNAWPSKLEKLDSN